MCLYRRVKPVHAVRSMSTPCRIKVRRPNRVAPAAAGGRRARVACDRPGTSNDECPTSAGINPVLANGTGVPQTFDNTCAHVDAPTSVSGTLPATGLWYAFNSGPNTRHRLHLLTHAQNPAYSANAMSYALYTGTCTGLGASGELVAVAAGSGVTDLPLLAPNTAYRLLAYQAGSLSETGSYGVLIDHPGINDAGITAVNQPTGLVCGTTISPGTGHFWTWLPSSL